MTVGERDRMYRAGLTNLGEQRERVVAVVRTPRRERLLERGHAFTSAIMAQPRA